MLNISLRHNLSDQIVIAVINGCCLTFISGRCKNYQLLSTHADTVKDLVKAFIVKCERRISRRFSVFSPDSLCNHNGNIVGYGGNKSCSHLHLRSAFGEEHRVDQRNLIIRITEAYHCGIIV